MTESEIWLHEDGRDLVEGEAVMHVHDAMSTEIVSIEPQITIKEAARIMSEKDVGVLPVVQDSRVVGIVTDRDITVRATAIGANAERPIRDIMSLDVQCCHSADSLLEALDAMGEQKVRRMPVLSQENELVGILSLGDVVCVDDDFRSIGRALRDICTPHGLHSQLSSESASQVERRAPQHSVMISAFGAVTVGTQPRAYGGPDEERLAAGP